MNLEQALSAHLRAHTGLTALVGDRIYPLVLPQGCAMPAITYSRVSGTKQRMLTEPGPRRTRMQISCWGARYADPKALVAQVSAALQDFQGVLGGPGGIEVLDADVLDNPDLYEEEALTYHVPVDVMILYQGGT